ncbi:MAG: imelysin family protein [Pseudomonadota bacterium]
MINRFATCLAVMIVPLAAWAADPDHRTIASDAVTGHILPAYDRFAAEAGTLAEVAPSCDTTATRNAYHRAFDAWMGVAHISFGPAEAGGRMFAIAFWPDKKGQTGKALRQLMQDQDPAILTPDRYGEQSIAARGLFAMERMLFDEDLTPDDGYHCLLTAAIASDLARSASDIRNDWDGYAAEIAKAGADDAAVFYGPDEPTRALFNALSTGLQFTTELRLARPLGSIQRPRPKRAEAWRSARPLRNIRLSLAANRDLWETAFEPHLSKPDADAIRAAFDYAQAAAEAAPAPLVEAVATPSDRLKIDALRGAVDALREAVIIGVGGGLALTPGFNALDGD